jgi:hypothetical protein
MSLITIIRAQGAGALELVVPGESLIVQPGDRILCDIPFTEAASILRLGEDLHIILHGNIYTYFKQFFSTATAAIQSVIKFQDQELTVDDLNKLLSIKFSVTEADGNQHDISMVAGCSVSANPGDFFHLNSQEFAIKDLHRQGEDLIIKEHDAANVSAILRGFFITPHDNAEPPQLQLTDPELGTAQDMIIHPRAAVFQWQGEPLPQAIVGALYGYYFHLQGKDAENFTLVAKTEEGALPPWLTFAGLGAGKFLLSGMPPADAVGSQSILISAHSIAHGVGLHTQQSYFLAVKTRSDWVTRAGTNDVAAAEFRKAGESFETDNYISNITNVDQMPYMTMPEIAALSSMVAMNQVAMNQNFSTYSTAEEVASVRALESLSNNTSQTTLLQLPQSASEALLTGHSVSTTQTNVIHVISPVIAPVQSPGEMPGESTTPTSSSQGGGETTAPVPVSPVPPPMVMEPVVVTPTAPQTEQLLIFKIPPSYAAPPTISPGEYGISENSPHGTVVGTVSATDPDPGDVLTYSIYNGVTAFTINSTTGVISVGDMSQLDYETTHSFMVGVQVTDLGGNQVQTLLGIYLGNINDNAPIVDLNGAASGNDFSVHYTIGAVNLAAPSATVTDADAPDYPNLQSITVTITNALDGSHEVLSYSFMDSNNTLQSGSSTSGSLTFTGPASLTDMQTFLQNVTYTDNALNPSAGDRIITIQGNDGLNLSNVTTSTVTITADTPPNISPQTFAIGENSANTTAVGTVVASDADVGDFISNYSIIGGTGASAFAINSISGVISVTNSNLLDYEVTTSFTLDVQVVDKHGVTNHALITVDLNNLNDNPPIVDLNGPAEGNNFAVNFNGPTNIAAPNATITDADAPGFPNVQSITVTINNVLDAGNEVLSYNFIDSNNITQSGSSSDMLVFNGSLSLSDVQALLQSITYNDTASTPTAGDRTITVQVNDGLNLSNVVTSTVTITVNHQPVISPQTFAIDENSINNTTVGTVVASDPDVRDSVAHYTIIGGTGSEAFTINDTTGVITVLNSGFLDYEAHTSFTLDVKVTDTHGAISDAIITINLNNLNDTAPLVDLNEPGSGTNNIINYLGPVHIATSNATITDADAPGFPNIQSVTVTITNNLDGANEVLNYNFTDSNNMVHSGSSNTGVLTFTGPLSLADMQAFVQSVTYQDNAASPNTANRIITVVANDGINNSNIATANITHGFSFADLNGSNGLLFIGSAGQANGLSVTVADLNGDGNNDVIIGNWTTSSFFQNGFTQTDVLFGGPNISSVGPGGIIHASDLNGVNGFRIDTNSIVYAVGGAGDINGDGIPDLIILTQNPSQTAQNGYVVLGAHNIGSSGDLIINNLDGSSGFQFTAQGQVVGNAGDLNGDGFQDFFIGLPNAGTGFPTGSAVVIFGSPAINSSNVLNISTLNGGHGFQFDGSRATHTYDAGYSMSGGGDLNNDGYQDLVISSLFFQKDFVIFGGPTVGQSGIIHDSDLNGTNGFVITNSQVSSGPIFGHKVDIIGDVNGDGIADLMVTYPSGGYNNGGPDGTVYVVFGGNGLGASGTLDLAHLTPSTGATFLNYAPGVNSVAKSEAAGIGDINGDGLQDFAFSATDRVTGLQKIYVIFGSTTLGSYPVDLNNLSPSQGMVIYTAQAHDFITSITKLGDVNGDGIGDFAVGIGLSSVNGYRSGQTAIVFGGNFTGAITQLGDASNNTINGTAGNDRIFTGTGNHTVYGGAGNDYIHAGSGNNIIYGGDGNDTLIGGPGNDILFGGNGDDLLIGGGGVNSIYGGAGNDTIVYENNNNAHVDGGTGIDTLWVRDGGIAADLHGGNAVDLRGTSIYTNFEVINLKGDTLAPNSVTLDIATVLSMTDANHVLTIIGTSRDTVGLEPGQFTDIGSFVTSFGTVERYTGGGATIDVLSGLKVSQVSTLDLSAAAPGINYHTTFSGTPLNLAGADAVLTDPDGNITQILVRITNLQDGAHERLSATATGNISVTYSPSGVLLLSGNDTPANYLTALHSLQYYNTAGVPSPADRLITFEVSDTGGVSHIATTTVAISPAPLVFSLSSLTNGVSGFDLTPIIHRPNPNEYAATSSAIVHNGDGFDSLLIANGFVAGDAPFARAFMIHGQATFNSPIPFNDPSLTLTTFNNDSFGSPIAAYGQLVASVGDYNGDGFNDVLIGTFFGGPSELVLGTAQGFTSPVMLSQRGIPINNGSVTSVAGLGDVNGDGHSDFMLSDSTSGKSSVFFGTLTPTATLDMTSGQHSGFNISIANSSLPAGTHDITAVDLNGDGKNEVLVSYFDTVAQTGGIAVLLGSTPAFSSTVAVVGGTSITGANGFFITNSGAVPGANSVLINPTNIGNFNGSGLDAIALSSHNTVYVIFGSTAYTSGSNIDVAQLNGTNGFALTSPTTAQITSISYVGDVNGDGIADVAFIDQAADGGHGAIYVIFGSTTPFAANIDFTHLSPTQGFEITTGPGGLQLNETVGNPPAPPSLLSYASVTGGGDLNGDGLGDIVITSGSHEYVVFGANFNGAITHLGGSAGGTIIGGPGNETIYAGNADNQTIIPGSGTNFINTGVGADTIDGTVNNGNNTIVYSPFNVAVNAGSGTNTLWFEQDSQAVSFIGNTHYSGLHTINLEALRTLTGNSITLDPAAVLSMSKGNLLVINGNAEDSVHLKSDGNNFWAQSGSIPGYNVWTSTSIWSPSGVSTVEIATSINKISVVNLGTLTINDLNLNGVNGVNIAPPTSGESSGPGFATSLALLAANTGGDGFADLAIETPFGQPSLIGSGQVFLVHGTALTSTGGSLTLQTGVNTGLVYSSSQRFGIANISNPASSYSKFGINFVGDVGSFTGAGTHDLLIATDTSVGHANPGTEYIVFGPLSSITSAHDISSMVTSGTAMAITGAGYLTGAGMGDINGDGLADVGVHLGWQYNVSQNASAAKIFILFGASSPPPHGTILDINTLNGIGTGGFIISNDHVSSTGAITQLVAVNLNGDAFNDIVYHYNNTANLDIVNVVFGSSTLGTSNVDGTTLATTLGSGVQFINGTETAANGFGTYMANIGNFTGNGYDSLALADPSAGTVYVVYGSAAFTTHSGQFDLATMTVNQGFTLTVPVGDTITGLSYLGDVNGDGLPDIAIAVQTSGGLSEALVVFGSHNPFPSTMSAVATDVSHGFTIQNYGAGNVATPIQSLVGGADLNGDGISDIVISNFYSNPGVHVVFGANFSSVITQTGGATPGTITGNPGNEVIYAGAADQTIIPGSGTNFIDTGAGHDIINGLTHNGNNTIVYSAFDNAANQIQAGNGHNTLWLEHDGNNVNLVGTNIFTGFDEINLQALQTQTGNSLTLDPTAVNAMSHGNALAVQGNAQDALTLTHTGSDVWSILSSTLTTTTYASALTSSHVTVDNSMVNAGHVHII